MMHRVVFKSAVEEDIREVFEYLAARSEDAATRFIEAANSAFEQLSRTPAIGSFRRTRNPRLRDLRSLTLRGFKMYTIFYLVEGDMVSVIRLLHASRDIDSILDAETD